MPAQQYLITAINAAIEAGGLIMDIYRTKQLNIELKSDQSPVTRADKRAHEAIVQYLAKTGINIIREEDTQKDIDNYQLPLYWLIDPLDGTKDFIQGTGEFGVNIALIKDGTPIIGVIYLPARKELYFGSQTCHSRMITLFNIDTVSDDNLLNAQILPIESNSFQPILLQSRMYPNQKNDIAAQLVGSLLKSDVWIMEMGSTFKYVEIAKGKGWFYPRDISLCKWDLAAGHALINFSGGVVLNLTNGEEIKYNTTTDQIPPFLAISAQAKQKIPINQQIELFQRILLHEK